MPETKTITLVTRAGAEDRNGRTYAPEACRRIVELLNHRAGPDDLRPGVPVLTRYPDHLDEVKTLATAAAVGLTMPGSAAFDGERITVQVLVLDGAKPAEAWAAHAAGGVNIGTGARGQVSPSGLVFDITSIDCLAMFRDEAPAVPALVGHKGDQEFSTGVLMACPRCGALGTLGKFTCCIER